MILNNGVWTSKFPPGHSLLLTVGGFGYPNSIATGPQTDAKLFRVASAVEVDEAVTFLGPDRPVMALRLDEESFAKTGNRTYRLQPFSVAKPTR